MIPHPNKPYHVENLNTIALLEEQGFKGQDSSLSESLFEYGIAWKWMEATEQNPKELCVIYRVRGDDDPRFDRCSFKKGLDPRQEWDWVNWGDVEQFAGQMLTHDVPLEEIICLLINYYGVEEIMGTCYWEGFKITEG